MAFEIQGLNKTFGEYKAVNDLNIRVEEGGILGMLGRNGAGKTTTIRMILDLIKPDSAKFYGIIALFKERPIYWLFTRRAWIIPENECSGAIGVFRQVRRNAS